jgi:ribulose-5-phosphate 4-epimerase/fuculose-1-phosphate aldolase
MVSDRIPPRYPKFDNVADERRHHKQRLAAAFRIFGRLGFDEGLAGHITARDPELPDHFWVNPLGMNFRQIRAKDLLLVNDRGEVVERACQAQLLAEAAGVPIPIDPENAAKTFPQVGNSVAGWWAFQPSYDWIVTAEPDLLDDS